MSKQPARKSNYLPKLHRLAAMGLFDGTIQLGAVHHIDVYHDDWCDLLDGRGPCNCLPPPGPAWTKGRTLMTCELSQAAIEPGKNAAQYWADADPPLRSLVNLLLAAESHKANLPDFMLVFDPIIQAIRVPLVELGHLRADQSLTARCAQESLPNLFRSNCRTTPTPRI